MSEENTTEENTAEEKIPKELAGKIGRSFALLYNRLSMYNQDHPFAAQALDDYFDIVDEGLSYSSPVVVIMYKDQFFVEEEPLDPRINTSKMLAHFKKTGIQSISFLRASRRQENLKIRALLPQDDKMRVAEVPQSREQFGSEFSAAGDRHGAAKSIRNGRRNRCRRNSGLPKRTKAHRSTCTGITAHQKF